MGNEQQTNVPIAPPQVFCHKKEENIGSSIQDIQNQEPTDLTRKINRQFKRTITASRDIMIDRFNKPAIQQPSLENLKKSIKNLSFDINQIAFKLQEKMLAPVFDVFTRMKVKRPVFEMIQIDLKKFMKMKQTSIYTDYEIMSQIGRGGFGCVYKAKEKKSSQLRAIKKIKKQYLDEQQKLNLMNQFQILKEMDHPNIIKLYDIYDDHKYFYVVTELCQGGNLLSFVNTCKMTQNIMIDVMVQLLSAIKYMHGFKYLHRDIKLQNIVLVKKIKDKDEKIQIKLIDFGISCNLNKIKQEDFQPIGTLLYMSPQSLEEKLQLSSDLWSCGIVLYMMATRKVPYMFKCNEQLLNRIKKGEIIRKNLQSLSVDIKVFIIQLLQKNQKRRLTASAALQSRCIKRQIRKSNITQTKRVKAAKNLLDYDPKNNLISIIESYLVFKKINQDERQRLALIFENIDKDKSGIIDIQEFKHFYSQTSQHYDASQVEELLKAMDKNRSGKIDFNQFIIAMHERRKLFQLQSLEEAFDYFDKDSSGEISKKELESILQGIKHQEIQYLFGELDKNHDQKISKSQFLAYLNNYQRNNNEV